MEYTLLRNGTVITDEGKSIACYTCIYIDKSLKAFYFRDESGMTARKVEATMELKGFNRYYVIEDWGFLEALWEGYISEAEVLEYINFEVGEN
jgi:hypothetical protein